jgi:acetoin utilization deacetylase AcuC-like enzyme
MVGDPLGGMKLTPEGIIKRDEMVFDICLQHDIPVLMVLSGGYQRSNAPVIGRSIVNLMNKFNLRQHQRKRRIGSAGTATVASSSSSPRAATGSIGIGSMNSGTFVDDSKAITTNDRKDS